MKKALIVDDEAIARQFVRAILTADGWEVQEAEDGSEGLALAKASPPDLIILDVQMPKMDGFKVFNRLVNDPATVGIPVIMLTGVAAATGLRFSAEEMGEFFGKEPAAYVEKPVDPPGLRRVVNRVMSNR